MKHSLPGLSLAAAVVVAAVVTLLALGGGGEEPREYRSPPAGSAILDLEPAQGGVAGVRASSKDRKRIAERKARKKRELRAARRRAERRRAARKRRAAASDGSRATFDSTG